MKVVGVSACLLGENCRYSGGNKRNAEVLTFVEDKKVIPVCPEVAGGLPTPRPPSEMKNGIVYNRLGECVDEAFRLGAKRCVDALEAEGVELVILQPRSPSCGVDFVYDGTFSGNLIPGDGVFAQLLKERGIPLISADHLAEMGVPNK